MGILGFLKKNKSQKRLAIIDVTDSNFKQQVVRRSYKSLVLVDYWAAWCGPCRHLGPILEKIAEDPESNFILAKLNTEYNPKTANQYQIRSIPNVKAFRNGQVINEFSGAIPESLVRRFIQKCQSTQPPTPQISRSDDPARRLRQAEQHLKKGRGFEAFVMLNDFPESPESPRAGDLLPLARFLFDMDDGDGLTGIEELDEQYLAAANALKRNKPEIALNRLDDALEAGEEIDESYTKKVIDSLKLMLE